MYRILLALYTQFLSVKRQWCVMLMLYKNEMIREYFLYMSLDLALDKPQWGQDLPQSITTASLIRVTNGHDDGR